MEQLECLHFEVVYPSFGLIFRRKIFKLAKTGEPDIFIPQTILKNKQLIRWSKILPVHLLYTGGAVSLGMPQSVKSSNSVLWMLSKESDMNSSDTSLLF